MTSGEPGPGTRPESLAQDPRAEAARLWEAAIIQFGNPADSSAAASPAGLPPRDDALRARQEYIVGKRSYLLSRLNRDQISKEQDGHPVSIRQQELDSTSVQRQLAGLPEHEKESYLQRVEKLAAGILESEIVHSRIEPNNPVFNRIEEIYTPEDTQRIMADLHQDILNYLINRSIPVSDYHETGSDKYGPAELEDYRWLGRWRDYFEANPQLGFPPSKNHYNDRIQAVETQIIAAGGTVTLEAGEPQPELDEPEVQPDPVQEARDTLQNELIEIGKFFEGKKPERGYLEDWQAENMRRQGKWIRVDYLGEYAKNWLQDRIAPLIFQARLRGDDQLAIDFVNLCSPDQFDTLILAVGQLIKEATAKG